MGIAPHQHDDEIMEADTAENLSLGLKTLLKANLHPLTK